MVKTLPANAGDTRDVELGSCWVGNILWSRKWQPTPVFLPGKFHAQRSLVGYSPWGGHRRVGHDLATEHTCIVPQTPIFSLLVKIMVSRWSRYVCVCVFAVIQCLLWISLIDWHIVEYKSTNSQYYVIWEGSKWRTRKTLSSRTRPPPQTPQNHSYI